MKSIILTGVSRGLGKALHKHLVCEKYAADQKIFISRNFSCESNGGSLSSYIALDFSDLIQNLGAMRIDPMSEYVVFINNAGTVEPIGAATGINPSDLQSSMNINCLAPLQLAQYLTLLTQKANQRLFILNVSSGATNRPVKGWLAYCVSKVSAKMAFDVLAAENEHVEVLHFDPGVMDTDMQVLIRSQPRIIMPDVEIFHRYKTEKKLKAPSVVAKEIIKIIEGFKL